MKSTKSKPSARKNFLAQPTGRGKAGAAAACGFSAAAPASSVAPKPSKLILKGQTITKVPARPARVKRVPVALPARIVRMMFNVPEVVAEIELRERLAIVKAVNAMVATGMSANNAARAQGISPSRLSDWRAAYAKLGREGLRPTRWNAGRKPTSGRARRHSAFIELVTARR